MSNQPNFYDYALDGDAIHVLPSEDKKPVTFDAAQFFAWLVLKGYATDYHFEKSQQIAIETTPQGHPVWMLWADWWAEPFVIYNALEPIPAGVSLLDYLLHNFVADQCDGDERTINQLPEQFLTTEEKCRRVDTTGQFTMYLKNGTWWVKDHAGLFYTFLYAPICSNECPWKDESWSATVYKDDPARAFELEFLTAAEKAAKKSQI